MSSTEATDGPTVTKTVVETVLGVSEMTITTIKADTNGATSTITTNAVEAKVDAAPVKTVTEVKPNVAPVEPVVKATPAPAKTTAASTNTASTPAKTDAVPAKTAKADTSAKTPAKPAAKTAPPGYKLIKVKNADGKIIVVKKKLTEAELAAAAEKRGQTVTPDNTASEQTKSVEYKIVSIPQSDGTLVKVRRAVHAEDVTDKAKPKPKPANPKDGKAVAVSEKEVDDADDEAPISEAKRQEMIRKQKHKFRMGRTRKYRRSMLRGFAMQLIGELPDIELDSHGFQDGDQVISDDDSDLDFDSDGGSDDHDLFGHHDHDDGDNDSIIGGGNGNGNGNGNGADHGNNSAGASGSGSHIDISSKAIATNIYDNVAAQTNKKKSAATATAVEVPAPAKTKDAPASGTAKAKASEKVTYKMTDKDLEKLDEEKPSSQLQHHWESISFYLMASLSIILPLLFVLLCIGTTIMDGKSVGSRWDSVANALKFAVSAWPIVFAAVVAQCFKTYATYRVERGIKLMQLEQLVGSNSFASAIKQPIILRRLDIYTLAIFVAWCLSPIGGQALVRVQSGEWRKECTNTTIWYLSRNGINPVFDPANDYYNDGNDYGTHLQQATMTFGTIFDPDSGLGGNKVNYYQDNWGNPQTLMASGNLSSVFGIPYFVTDSLFYAESQPYYYDSSPLTKIGYSGTGANMQRQESFNFTLESSYFAFECGDWQTLSSADMADKIAEYDLECTVTDSPTYYMAFGWPDSDSGDDLDGFGYNDNTNASASILRWGSFNWLTAKANASTTELIAINGSDPNQSPMRNSTATYSYIECPVAQHYLEYNIQCGIAEEDYENGAAYQCLFVGNPLGTNLSASTQHGTPFYQFTSDFVDAVVPTIYSGRTTISPFERFLASGGRKFDTLFEYNDGIAAPGKINTSYAYWYDMAENTTPYDFGGIFSFAFNSWMDAGYCPGTCRTAYPTLLLKLAQDEAIPIATVENHLANASSVLNETLLIPEEMFQSVEGTWCYTANYVYVVHVPYLVLLYVCSISLFVLGVVSVIIESRVVAPDVLGYASTVARNSRYLHLPATAPGLSGADRVRKFGGTVVMMQDVKKDAAVGKIALGNKKHDSAPLRVDRTYR